MATILQNHYVHDVREAARFYADVLGFAVVSEPAGWVFVRKDNWPDHARRMSERHAPE